MLRRPRRRANKPAFGELHLFFYWTIFFLLELHLEPSLCKSDLLESTDWPQIWPKTLSDNNATVVTMVMLEVGGMSDGSSRW